VAAGRTRLALAAALGTLLFKEDAVFVALAVGGLMYGMGYRRAATVTGGIAVLYAALAALVVMPAIRGGAESDLVERYGYLADLTSPAAFLASLPAAPERAVSHLADAEILAAGAGVVVAGALASLTRPGMAAWILPGLLLALLSTHPAQSQLEFHYAAPVVVVGNIASASALPALAARVDRRLLGGALLGLPLLVGVWLNPVGAANGSPPGAEHQAAVLAGLELVPGSEDVSVSAQSGLLSRLSHRRGAYEFPYQFDRADWVVVDRYGFRSSQSLDAGFDARLAQVRNEMELVYSRDGVEVFRRRK
jgi:hypothetical protein